MALQYMIIYREKTRTMEYDGCMVYVRNSVRDKEQQVRIL